VACRHGAGHRLFCVSAAGSAGCAAVRIVPGGAVFSRCQALVPRRADMSRRAAIALRRGAVARAVHHGFSGTPLFPDVMVWHARIETASPLVSCRRAVAIRRRHACVRGNGCGGAGHSRVRSLVWAAVARRRVYDFCLRGNGDGVSQFPDGVAGIDRARNDEFAGSLQVHRRVLDGAMESCRVGIFSQDMLRTAGAAWAGAGVVCGVHRQRHLAFVAGVCGAGALGNVRGVGRVLFCAAVAHPAGAPDESAALASGGGARVDVVGAGRDVSADRGTNAANHRAHPGSGRPGAVDGGDGRARGGGNGFSSGGFVDGLFPDHPGL